MVRSLEEQAGLTEILLSRGRAVWGREEGKPPKDTHPLGGVHPWWHFWSSGADRVNRPRVWKC